MSSVCVAGCGRVAVAKVHGVVVDLLDLEGLGVPGGDLQRRILTRRVEVGVTLELMEEAEAPLWMIRRCLLSSTDCLGQPSCRMAT